MSLFNVKFRITTRHRYEIMNPLRRPSIYLLLFLVILNVFFLIKLLYSNTKRVSDADLNAKSEDAVATKIDGSSIKKVLKKIDKGPYISISLPVMHIYRLDISCDYIVKDLDAKIPSLYANKQKKCSLASLKGEVNKMIEDSLEESKHISASYEPVIALSQGIDFDPFSEQISIDRFNKYFNSLDAGGAWSPTLKANSPCGLADLDNVVFIITYSSSRLQNLKLFLLNMHAFLQNLRHPFKVNIERFIML
jgi:hypothetical protein